MLLRVLKMMVKSVISNMSFSGQMELHLLDCVTRKSLARESLHVSKRPSEA